MLMIQALNQALKEGVSTQKHEMSSEVHEDVFSFGSPGDWSLEGGV